MSGWIFGFAEGRADGDASMRELLGGKGANLAEMSAIGLPVPAGFTISTNISTYFYENDKSFPDGLSAELRVALADLERSSGRSFGGGSKPLLVSIRSGSRASMPGMMDTILNLGLNDETVHSLAKETGDERFAFDSYRRFIQMYACVVLGLDHAHFEDILTIVKGVQGFEFDTNLSVDDWHGVIESFKAFVEVETGKPFPQDVQTQLWGAITAVFSSWMSRRAVIYRGIHNIPDHWGTAVNIQAMVFGNLGEDSASGVAFTRNPNTGEKQLFGEYLANAQGEDVVAGIRTPHSLTEIAMKLTSDEHASLESRMPKMFGEIVDVATRLENHFCDMQDIEFTIENDKLWILQTRSGKRTSDATLRIAVELAQEGTISRSQALERIDPYALNHLLHPTLAPSNEQPVIVTGLPASPGAACGEVCFSPERAEALRVEGKATILVRLETSPEDILGMDAAKGILTARGGATSHAAVVARGMGKPCIVGAGSLKIDYEASRFTVMGRPFHEGDIITLDGSTGRVYAGSVQMNQPEFSSHFATLMEWADNTKAMKIRANADTPTDAKLARSFGAEGIGLCRTERMFFESDRINAMREMILAENAKTRREALEKLLTMQRADFIEMFEIMAGLPVAIRLLDPPLHEFLPNQASDIEQVANAMDIETKRLQNRVDLLYEVNPMLGHRGCRLAIAYPEVVEMQARAIFEAALAAAQNTGSIVAPEIMVPVVSMNREFLFVKACIEKIAGLVAKEQDAKIDYTIGTIIELPRAALIANELAENAGFLSFGTNDLTQTCFGMSRDDATGFLRAYERLRIMPSDPFVTIDEDGVGELMKIAIERGKSTRSDIEIGICGEHGGDPKSIIFCSKIGIDYVSCSPYRVPIARLAAAQATK
ncbi:MAG: pyruvate, phosphate dikinase [Rhizobiaceae bacterium]